MNWLWWLDATRIEIDFRFWSLSKPCQIVLPSRFVNIPIHLNSFYMSHFPHPSHSRLIRSLMIPHHSFIRRCPFSNLIQSLHSVSIRTKPSAAWNQHHSTHHSISSLKPRLVVNFSHFYTLRHVYTIVAHPIGSGSMIRISQSYWINNPSLVSRFTSTMIHYLSRNLMQHHIKSTPNWHITDWDDMLSIHRALVILGCMAMPTIQINIEVNR